MRETLKTRDHQSMIAGAKELSRLRQLSAESDVSTSIVDLKYLKHQNESLSAQ